MSGVPQWAPEPQHIHPSSNPSSPAGLGAPLSVVTTGVPSLVMSANTAPSIATTVTPTTPTASIPAASALPPHVRTSERNLAAAVEDPSAATLSPTGSSASSPVHASIRRIHSTQRVASQMTGSSGISSVSSVALSPGGISQASLVSTQYPGEEADAFHVRSTCKWQGEHGADRSVPCTLPHTEGEGGGTNIETRVADATTTQTHASRSRVCMATDGTRVWSGPEVGLPTRLSAKRLRSPRQAPLPTKNATLSKVWIGTALSTSQRGRAPRAGWPLCRLRR